MYQTYSRRIPGVVYGNQGAVNAKHISGFAVSDGVVYVTLANGGGITIHQFPEGVADDDAVCIVAVAVYEALNGYLVPVDDEAECTDED